MLLLIVGFIVLVLVGLAVLIYRSVRKRAVTIEQSSLPTEEKVHRLQRLMFRSQPFVLLLIVLSGGAIGGSLGAAKDEHVNRAVVLALSLFGFVAAMWAIIMIGRTLRVALSRVRESNPKIPFRKRQLVFGLITAIVIYGAFFAARALLPDHGPWRAFGVPLVYFVVIIALQTIVAPLTVKSFGASELPADTRSRLTALADQMAYGYATSARSHDADRRSPTRPRSASFRDCATWW